MTLDTKQTDEAVSKRGISPWVIAILLLQATAALWLGLPGHLSTDSIIQLYEGRTHQTISFNPPLMSILLGVLDRLGNAPVGFVLLSQALLSWCTWLVLTSGGRQAFWRYLLAAVFLLNPVVMAYVGILWKDVLFAHVNILLFLLLARWQSAGLGLSWRKAALLIVLLTFVIGLRQQGILFAVVAAVWAVSMLRLSRIRSSVAILAMLIVPAMLNSALTNLVQKPFPSDTPVNTIGFKILMYYDLVGIVANGGTLAKNTGLPWVEGVRQQVSLYTPDRVDTLSPTEVYRPDPLSTMARIWWHSILESPLAYFKHRLRVTEAIVGLSSVRACLPIHSGVGGPVEHPMVPQELTVLLGLKSGPNPSTALAMRKAWTLATTPIFMHWAYAVVLAAVCVVMVKRRAHVLLSLAACSFILLASYAVLGIACDFRYVYTLTEATSLLAAWAMLRQPKLATAPA